MKKYLYRVIEHSDIQEMNKALHNYGVCGWRVIKVIHSWGKFIVFLELEDLAKS